MPRKGDHLYSLLAPATNEWRAFRMGSAAEMGGASPGAIPPAQFSFDSGHPPVETHPVEEFKELTAEVLGASHSAFEYGQGQALRAELVKWVTRRQGAVDLDPGCFTLASGGTEAIALVIAAVLGPGDVALIEALTFPYANRFMLQGGVDVHKMDIDHDGIVIERLEQQLNALRSEGKPPRLLYTISTYNLPTGAVLPLDRRRRILELAEEHDLVVLEDAVYSDLQYEGEPNPPSLLSLDTSGRVIQIHSFSKILVPSLRIGWACGAPELIDGLNAQRRGFGSGGVGEWLSQVVAKYMARGRLDPHIDELNRILLRKRDIAIGAVREYCGEWTDFRIPTGGFYLWVAVDDRVDLDRAKREAAQRGVLFRSDDAFVYTGGGRRHFRLPFASMSDEGLVEGIRIVGEALAHCAQERPAARALTAL